jgi:hypothetical protein
MRPYDWHAMKAKGITVPQWMRRRLHYHNVMILLLQALFFIFKTFPKISFPQWGMR